MKICFKCKSEKPYSDFYKHPRMADGHLGKCKDCAKVDTIQNRNSKPEYYKEYDKKRSTQPDRVSQRLSRANRWVTEFPERFKANRLLVNAVKRGEIKRQPCFVCGKLKTQGHHPDYSSPLDVVWLCTSHHVQLHVQHANYLRSLECQK